MRRRLRAVLRTPGLDPETLISNDLHAQELFTLRASRRGGDRESFRESVSKMIHLANILDAQDAWGGRELRAVKISALNDSWRYHKHKQNGETHRKFFFGFRHYFVAVFLRSPKKNNFLKDSESIAKDETNLNFAETLNAVIVDDRRRQWTIVDDDHPSKSTRRRVCAKSIHPSICQNVCRILSIYWMFTKNNSD